LAIALMVFLWFMASDDPFGIFKILVIVLSVLLRFMASDYPLWYLQNFSHCIVCPSKIYGFWWPLCHHFGIFKLFLSVLKYTPTSKMSINFDTFS
jgi:hypothetical protein